MFLRNLVLIAALGAAVPAALCAPAQPATQASLDDIAQVLRLSGTDKTTAISIRRGIEMGNRKLPESAVDTDIYLSFVTNEGIVARLAPLYAKHLTGEYVSKLIAAYQTPVGKQVARLQLVESESGGPAVQAMFRKLSPTDQRAVNAFMGAATFKSLINAGNKSSDDARAMFSQWSTEVMSERTRQVRTSMANIIELEIKAEQEELRSEAADAALAARVPRTGMRSFDQESMASFNLMRKFVRLDRKFSADLKQANMDDVLKPENLVTRQGIETGNFSLLMIESLFDAQNKANEELVQEYDRTVAKIAMTADQRSDFVARDTSQKAELFDFQLRMSERVRALIAINKNMLAFCESRLGKTKIEDGALMFPSDADVTAYNTLVAQQNKEQAQIKQLVAEDIERRKQAADQLRAPAKLY
jgi:hypothetical protein